MDDISQAVQSALTAGGGKMSWDTFVNLVPAQHRQKALDYSRKLQADGICKRQVSMIEGKPVLEVIAL